MTDPLTHRPFMTLLSDRKGRRRVVTLVPPPPDPDRSHVEPAPIASTTPAPTSEPGAPSSSPSPATAPVLTYPLSVLDEPQEAPVAAKKKRGRRVIDDATKAKAVARVLAKRPGETVESIARELDVSRSALDNWVAKAPKAKRARAPIVGIAEQASFAARARDITDGAALLSALNQYIDTALLSALNRHIDTRIEQGVKTALAALIKGGLG
jgi:transposase-like protein